MPRGPDSRGPALDQGDVIVRREAGGGGNSRKDVTLVAREAPRVGWRLSTHGG